MQLRTYAAPIPLQSVCSSCCAQTTKRGRTSAFWAMSANILPGCAVPSPALTSMHAVLNRHARGVERLLALLSARALWNLQKPWF